MAKATLTNLKVIEMLKIMVEQIGLGVKYIDLKIDDDLNALIIKPSKIPEPSDDSDTSLIDSL